jgi:hypothetical protein
VKVGVVEMEVRVYPSIELCAEGKSASGLLLYSKVSTGCGGRYKKGTYGDVLLWAGMSR